MSAAEEKIIEILNEHKLPTSFTSRRCFDAGFTAGERHAEQRIFKALETNFPGQISIPELMKFLTKGTDE